MTVSLTESIIDAMPNLEEQMEIIENGLLFRKKTINQWAEEIALPYLDSRMSVTEIQDFNFKFIEINEIVMENLAYAKSYNELSKAKYEIAKQHKQDSIISEIKADSTKRLPGVDALDRMAAGGCINEYNALKMTEVFLEFWRVQYDRLRLLDSRLSNINYLSGRHNV